MTHDDSVARRRRQDHADALANLADQATARRAHLDRVRAVREARQRRKDRIEMVVAIVSLASGLTCLGAMSYAMSALMEWINLPHNIQVACAVAGIAYLVYWVTKPRITVETDED